MAQKKAWEKEYAQQSLMTLGAEPQADVLRFLKWLKKDQRVKIQDLRVLDLGSGTGRNANYLATLGATVTAMEIASNALTEAKQRAQKLGVSVKYLEQSIGLAWPLPASSVELILDVTSSNSLTEVERRKYLSEANQVLTTGGYMFVRALCRDGDKNAKQLLLTSPGAETDTYVLKGVGITERVFSEADFRQAYGEDFEIVKLEKKTGYQRFNNQSYKRNYWLAYLRKK
jgi:SAM-dependent methyltransferase